MKLWDTLERLVNIWTESWKWWNSIQKRRDISRRQRCKRKRHESVWGNGKYLKVTWWSSCQGRVRSQERRGLRHMQSAETQYLCLGLKICFLVTEAYTVLPSLGLSGFGIEVACPPMLPAEANPKSPQHQRGMVHSPCFGWQKPQIIEIIVSDLKNSA